MNELADSLAVSACTFIPPLPPRFLVVIDEFTDLQIDLENEHDEDAEKPKLRSKIAAHEIVQLSTNIIPKDWSL
jgi:hypothetical protein